MVYERDTEDYYEYPIDDWSSYKAKSNRLFKDRFENRAPPRSLGEFERLRVLGAGSFGKVILVRDRDMNFYAMKMLDKQHIIATKQVVNTVTERRILTSLKFPFTMRLVYAFKDHSHLYMVMPFMRGGEMFNVLRKIGKFSEAIVKFFGCQVALALDYLHTCEIVFRDLKPENILIDNEGYLKVADFGFAKIIPHARTYTLCGTPEYIAPEVIRNRGYGVSADWWSYGVLMYEMAAGFSPFSHNDQMKLFEKITKCKYQMPRMFSNELANLVQNLLELDTTKRLGCLRLGANDILSHPYFRSVNILSLLNRVVQSPFRAHMNIEAQLAGYNKREDISIVIAAKNLYEAEFELF